MNDIGLLQALRGTARGLSRLVVLIGAIALMITITAVFDLPGARVLIGPAAFTITLLCVQAWRNFRAVAAEANERLAKAVVAEAVATQVRSHRRTGGGR